MLTISRPELGRICKKKIVKKFLTCVVDFLSLFFTITTVWSFDWIYFNDTANIVGSVTIDCVASSATTIIYTCISELIERKPEC